METQELESLLADLESDRVERKSSLADRDKLCEAICAFANDLPNSRRPGVLFIGVDDDGEPSGLPITDELLRKLADLGRNGNIHPFPSLEVRKHRLRNHEVAVVVVQPADAPPVRFRGRTWVRVGPSRDLATPDQERRLAEKRRWADRPFDLRPIAGAGLADLDLDLFYRVYLPLAIAPEVLAENQRTTEAQLASLRMLATGTESVATVLGLLVLGKDPRQHLAGAYVQFVRFEGTGLADPIRHQAIADGPLPEMVRRMEEILLANISVATDLASELAEVRRPDYPIEALRQLSVNAILHRSYESTHAPVRIYWYSDRIEISNPGGPFGQVNKKNFGAPGATDYRNPNLAEAMKNLGFVQQFGVGIERAKQALAKNGNPPPEFVVEESHVLAVLRGRP